MFVTLLDTLVALEVSISLLPVPALLKKGLGVRFVLGKALTFNVKNGKSVIVYAEQESDGLLFISEKQGATTADSNSDQETVRSMMAILNTSNYSSSSGDSTSGSLESFATTQYETRSSGKEENVSEQTESDSEGSVSF